MATLPLTNLAGVKTWLQEQQQGSLVEVASSLFDAGLVNKVFELLPDTDSFVLENCQIDADAASIEGVGNILDYQGTTAIFVFSEADGELALDVDLVLPSSEYWTLIEAFSLKFSNLRIQMSTNYTANVVGMRLISTLKTGSGAVSIPITVAIPSFRGEWYLAGSFDEIGNLSAAALEELAGNSPIADILVVEDLLNFSYFKLRSFEVAFHPFEKTCSLIDFQIAYGKPGGWTFFSELFTLNNLVFDFSIFNPISPNASKGVQAKLIAEMSMASVSFQVGGQFPDKVIFATLVPDTVLNLTEVFEYFQVSLPEGFPEIEISKLSFVAYLDALRLTFQLEITKPIPIVDELTLDSLLFDMEVSRDAATKSNTGSGYIHTVFSFGTMSMVLEAAYESEAGLLMKGALHDLKINDVVSNLEQKFGDMNFPDVLRDIDVITLELSFNTQTKDFHFLCEIDFPLDGKTAHLLLSIDIINTTDDYRKTFTGILTLGTRELSVVFDKTTTTSSLIAAFENKAGEPINLIDDVVGLVTSPDALSIPEDDWDVLTLDLYLLEFSYFKSATETTYGFKGDFGWSPPLELNSDSSGGFDIRAWVDLKKVKGGTNNVYGIICGRIENTIDGLDFLKLQACYEIHKNGNKTLKLLLDVGPVPLQATYSKSDAEGTTTTTLKFGLREYNDELEGVDQGINEAPSLTLGEVATFFVSLVDPSVIEYEFEPPWDGLAGIDLFDFLKALSLKLEIIKTPGQKNTTKFSIDFNLSGLLPSAMSSFVTIKKLSLIYTGNPNASDPKKKKSVSFSIEGKFLGVDVGGDDLSWDPVDGQAPEVPGQGISMFDLRYLGLGQRVAITQASNVASIGEVMGLLRGVIDEGQAKLIADRSLTQQNPLTTFGDGGAISFSPESEWLIGLDVSLLKVLKLTVIFNDPVIYGLRIELDGKMAKNFAGLKFEILYQKITDDIGKYHIDLTLPDFVRHFTVGAVSVTLPLIVIDIFTNGDFKLDFGFPWNFNFSRSFAIEVLPFTGAGGFYFNKLSAATATSTPAVVNGADGEPVGVFTPVYEFGLGLKIGLGKSFNSGPLKAEISITVQGIIEGVISWFNPRGGGDKELYYAIRGGVAIVGRLYGEVDFVVISVSVEVVARASVQFMVESYKDILIKLTAEVSVKAKAKVLFVTVKFKFSMKVEQSFTIDGPQHGQTPPWQIASRGIEARTMSMMSMRGRSVFTWNWADHTLWEKSDSTPNLDLFFQPSYTWVNNSASSNSGKVKGEALLFIENATGADREDFATLGKALFQWTCLAGGISNDSLSLDQVTELYDEFVGQPTALFSFEQLSTFLFSHFDFIIQAQDGDKFADNDGIMEGTIFPMFPQLSLTLGEADEDGNVNKVKFDEVAYELSAKQLSELKAYFAKLKVQFASASEVDTTSATPLTIGTTPITTYIFSDYIKIIIRAALQAAKDDLEARFLDAKKAKIEADKQAEANGDTPEKTLEQFVEEEMDKTYPISTDVLPKISFEPIANMASRFLMHGLCLPALAADGEHPARAKQPLYQATEQQFDYATAKVGKKYILKLEDDNGQTAFKFGEGADRSFTYELDEFDVDATQVRFALANTIHILQGLSGADIPIPKAQPSLIDFYGDEDNQINFALRKGTAWGGSKMLLDFPKSLTAYLHREINNPAFAFSKVPLSEDQPQIEDKTAVSGFTLATRIDINIKRVLNNEGTDFLPEIYLLEGTSEGEKDLLEAIFKDASDPDTLSLVYKSGSEGSGLTITDFPVASAADILIIKTNLSTDSHEDTTAFSAAMSETDKFMQFIWEGSSVSSGGYYLKIPHGDGTIDDALFEKESIAQITLILEFSTTFTGDPARVVPADFNTSAILTETIDLDEELLLAQSAEVIPVLRIPAGHLGFEHRRNEATDVYTDVILKKEVTPKAAPSDDATDLAKVPAGTVDAINVSNGYLCIASGPKRSTYGWVKIAADTVDVPALARNELDEIYQLMGYEIDNHPLTDKNKVEGLPVGPTGEGTWLYERVIPTFDGLAPDENGLPAPSRNPYLGISSQTAIKVDAWWQDLYGNKLSLNSKTDSDDFTLGYTDPIIGVNQWPSVLEHYVIRRKSNTEVTLSVEFAFNHSSYLAADTTTKARKKAVNAALVKYEQIYFQLKEADVQLHLKTTLFEADPTTGQALDKAGVLSFVEAIYTYLKATQALLEDSDTGNDADAPDTTVAPFIQDIDLTFRVGTDLKFQKEFIFGLTVFVEITRSLLLVHETLVDSGEIISDYENVIKSVDYLSPKQTESDAPTSILAPDNQTLRELAVASAGAAPTVADLLRTNLNVTGLLIEDDGDGEVLLTPADLVTVPSELKLRAEDWEAFQQITPAITISVQAGSSPEQLRVRFEEEINKAREAAIDTLQNDLPDDLDQLKETYSAQIETVLEEKAAELAEIPEENLEEIQRIEEEYRLQINEIRTQQNLDEKQLLKAQVVALNKLQNPINFTIEDLAAVLSNADGIVIPAMEWTLPQPSPLRRFAQDFEMAFPGLSLAVSEDQKKKNQAPDETRPLYIVQTGLQGVKYNILEQLPTFYAIPPMTNTLLSGQVLIDAYGAIEEELKQFDAVDLNELARNFLVAVEDFLEPDSLINAHALDKVQVEAVIAEKASLAKSISELIEPVLADSTTTDERLGEAQEAIRQQMLINLLEGYDVETIVQFEVAITVGDQLTGASELARPLKPRIVGKAKVVRVLQGEDPSNLVDVDPREYDFSLSIGKIPLKQVPEGEDKATSYFTYLFDTKTPEKYSNLYLELEFQSVGIEYAIEEVPSIIAYEASNWLTLIRPDNLKQSMGQSAIPIPLRDFPMPPSLIFQRAEPDPSSREVLADVRQWKYTIMFEHMDVAQDKIDCLARLNELQPVTSATSTGGSDDTTQARDTLFESLVNFGQLYPELVKDLDLFRKTTELTADETTAATDALAKFSALVTETAANWKDYTIPDTSTTHESVTGDLHYEISEEPLGDLRQGFVTAVKTIDGFDGNAAPDPILELPGYKEYIPTTYDAATGIKTFTYEEDPEDLTFFGDSSVPDRKFMIENLDVIPHQNAWASIWLSRNKGLLKKADNTDIPTNPKFVFQTPAVRFNNMVTPVIINDEPWNIATIDSPDGKPVKRTLLAHLTKMFETLFPDAAGQQPYEVQLSCRYAFALASGLGLNDDLKPTIPILLGLRLSSSDRAEFDGYPQDLATEIDTWQADKIPSPDDASLIFSISLFSKLDPTSNTSLPMLRIEHLELYLTDISE